MIELAAILLLALDRPLGGGTANIITRFDTDEVRAIPAVFLGSADTIPPVEWFLDGDGLLAPVAVSRFVPRPLDNDPPGIARGEYPIGQQGVDKPVFFRGGDSCLSAPQRAVAAFPAQPLRCQMETIG